VTLKECFAAMLSDPQRFLINQHSFSKRDDPTFPHLAISCIFERLAVVFSFIHSSARVGSP
jgi:hypothetical protein